MIKRKVLFEKNNYDGGQIVLPSAFPFYGQRERESLYLLTESERISKISSDMGILEDSGESCVIMVDENLHICDLTSGGESSLSFSDGISPFVISAIISALGEIDGESIVCLPFDEGLILSALAVKLMGFPVSKIVVPFEDFCGDNLDGVEIEGENLYEYLRDFYEDFDVLIGMEDAKGLLAGEIYTDGFSESVVAVTAFGVLESVEKVCFALSGKKKELKDAVKWIDNNCAYSCDLSSSTRKPTILDKKTMKELCNIVNKAKLY